MKLKGLKVDKRSFLRFRNKFGEVVACLNVGGEEDKTIPVGVAFCNPRDFNLRRKIRMQKGHGLAVHRAERAAEGVPGSVNIVLDNALGSMTDEERLERVRDMVVKYLSEGQFGFKTYAGERDGEFVSWFVPFVKTLRGEEVEQAA
jgi:hypothetical protein